MTPDISAPDASSSPRPVMGGLWGWWSRMLSRRATRRMTEPEIDDLRKRVVIIARQLDGLPISSRVAKRRMELLRDRERCLTIIAEWEERHVSGEPRRRQRTE